MNKPLSDIIAEFAFYLYTVHGFPFGAFEEVFKDNPEKIIKAAIGYESNTAQQKV